MMPKKTFKIVLITGLKNDWIADLIDNLKGLDEVEFAHVIYCKRKKSYLKNLKRNLKKHGVIYIPWRFLLLTYQVIFKRIINVVDELIYGKNEDNSFLSVCSYQGIHIHEVTDIHSQECVKKLKSLECNLFLVCGTGILKKSVFEIPDIGTINLHQGKVPEYRGMPPGFWELWNDEKNVGVTIHFIDDGVDTGDIVLQKNIPIFEYDNYPSVEKKLSEISLQLFPEAVKKIVSGNFERIKQPNASGKQYTSPTLKQMMRLKMKVFRKNFNIRKSIKNILKKPVFILTMLVITLRDHILKISGKTILSVLYYHRVTDICQDNITVSIDGFKRHARLLKRYFHVIEPSDLCEWLNQSENVKGKSGILITFDDGYEDNYLNALPILIKYKCPAIFFISTGLIGNNIQFEHEKELQPRLMFNKMNWEQIKIARDNNIVIGIHSDTHRNLGTMSLENGIREIEDSLLKYKHNIINEKVIMSYPFGGKNDISLELKKYIKFHPQITALFSAYGDKNISPIDKYDIKRSNIAKSDENLISFLFKVKGGFQSLLKSWE